MPPNRSKAILVPPVASSSEEDPGESELDANEAKRPKKKVGEEGMVTAPVVEEVKKAKRHKSRLFPKSLKVHEQHVCVV
ncbi:hypothetical protein Gohar_019378 [Gossypium harknessii]|uniref:Uncharacterized protein n=1 Tax=Gossypium harknessii TaxID=34285 RepID=A0A7J9IB60_9ROSI|nr:hypothetical protein [Gossypium harknessii]